jgi:hypothetical protein
MKFTVINATVKAIKNDGSMIFIPKRINREAMIPILKEVWLSGYVPLTNARLVISTTIKTTII